MKFKVQTRRFWSKWMIIACVGAIMLCMSTSVQTVKAAEGVTLFTPYTDISVVPGETIDYSLQVINNTDTVQTVPLTVSGLPQDWSYEFSSGGWSVREISVLPEQEVTVNMDVEVPLQIDKGNYMFEVRAGSAAQLPLTVRISEQGTYKSELNVDQTNMEGLADSTFTFDGELRNRTAEEQVYALSAKAPAGWEVQFTTNSDRVTSVSIEPNQTASINISVRPPAQVAAGTYTIPVSASTSSTSANVELEVVITGTYGLELTTPDGLLSTEVQAGKSKSLDLVVRNTGSTELTDVQLSDSSPVDWEVEFEPAAIESIPAGESVRVTAKITSSDQAIAGDYVSQITASTAEATDSAEFRVAVKTSMLWGWIGILIIIAALGCVYYLFRKYGRR
ncbi:NEW3 domain-containing protein [Marinicrinis lubricantis]|uniref:NEW3 domain-containing protein n=1 Tax=Marinicrinis lubricantis TaxID=2086470 RepID=A0ABW1IQA8_9BACL